MRSELDQITSTYLRSLSSNLYALLTNPGYLSRDELRPRCVLLTPDTGITGIEYSTMYAVNSKLRM